MTPIPINCGSATTAANIQCVQQLFGNVVYAALVLVGTLAVILIIIAGIRFITSGGDNKKLDGARKTITYAIIGLAVVLFSFFIINLLGVITGVKCISRFTLTGCS